MPIKLSGARGEQPCARHTDRSSSDPRGSTWPGCTGGGMGRPAGPALKLVACGAGDWARMRCTGAGPCTPPIPPWLMLAEKAESEPFEIMRSIVNCID